MKIDRRIASMCATACFVLALQAGIVSAAPSAVLYDQTDNPASSAIISQDNEPENDIYDCQAAADFQVPDGFTWKVTKITTPGEYQGFGTAQSLHVTVYANSGGLPGPSVCEYPFVTVFTGGSTGTFVITLPVTGCTLTQGAYWVSVQANMMWDEGTWNWR